MCLRKKDPVEMETVSFPENIDWYLLFLAEASYYKGKS